MRAAPGFSPDVYSPARRSKELQGLRFRAIRFRAIHRRRLLVPGFTLAACAAFMFLDFRTPPIVLWDESRIAVNALEMHLLGHLSLVTTYGFAPDLWNTKPPLLIWLMNLSMSLFGVSEWAMRLPSMLAAMGTLALTLSFVRRVTGSVWTGALAAGLLATSIVFFGEHGARTADYEALLCLFTTGYLYVLFFALHRRRPGWGRALLAGALIGLAIMTKSVAGLMPGLGAPLYLLLVGRWRRAFQPCWLLGAAPVALGPPLAFYALREAVRPGYLSAVIANDLSGRFTRTLSDHGGPPWYYLDRLIHLGGFSAAWGALAAPVGMGVARGRARLGLLYCLCIAGALIANLEFGATKLLHYAISATPFLAAGVAIGVGVGWRRLMEASAAGVVGPTLPALIASVGGVLALWAASRSAYFRATWLPANEFGAQSLYGELLDGVAARRFSAVGVVDGHATQPGFAPQTLTVDAYAPRLDFYQELAQARGQTVQRLASDALAAQPAGALIATCDPKLGGRVAALGARLAAPPGCVLVRHR